MKILLPTTSHSNDSQQSCLVVTASSTAFSFRSFGSNCLLLPACMHVAVQSLDSIRLYASEGVLARILTMMSICAMSWKSIFC